MHYLVTLLAVFAALASALGADWPTYKHDVQRSSVTDESLAFPLRLVWRVVPAQSPRPTLPPPPRLVNKTDFDYAPHPVIAGGLVYLGSSADDTLRAFNAKTGALSWQFITGGPVRYAPQVVDGRVYVASDDGLVYCLNAATGTPIWTFQAAPTDAHCIGNGRMISRWPCRNGVLVEDGVLYTVAGMWPTEGIYVYALDAKTGKVLWCNDTSGYSGQARATPWQPGNLHSGEFGLSGVTPLGPLLASRDTLLVPQGNNSPAVFSKNTGELLHFDPNATGSTWVTIDGSHAYTFSVFRTGLEIVGRPVADAGVRARAVRFSAAEIPQISPLTSRLPAGTQVKGKPVNLKRLPFETHGKGKVSALIHDEKLYARKAYGLALSAPAAPGVRTLFVGEDGAVVAVNAETHVELWRGQVQGEAREIAIADGCLFVVTHTGELSCFAPVTQSPATPPIIRQPKAAVAPVTADDGGVVARLRQEGMDRGYALVLGDAEGHLSRQLAARTALQVINVLPEEAAVARLRARLLAETGLYGYRIHVLAVPHLGHLPFAQYFANAVIVAGEVPGLSWKDLLRVLRPCGGVLLCPGLPKAQADALLAQSGVSTDEARIAHADGGMPYLVRGRLPGARDWDVNTSGDQRVKWPLRPLWFGGPDPSLVMNVGIGGHMPVAANGRYFVTGHDCVTAVDAYNGTLLWTRPIPTATPDIYQADGLYYDIDGAVSLASASYWIRLKRWLDVDGEHLYLRLGENYFRGKGEALIRLDARTGEQRQICGPYLAGPLVSLDAPQRWPLEIDAARAGEIAMRQDDAGVLLTLTTRGARVTKVDGWNLFFDFRPPAQRYGLYTRGVCQVMISPARDGRTPATWTPGNGLLHPRLEVTGTRDAHGTQTTVRLSWAEIEKLAGGGRPGSFGFAATLTAFNGEAGEDALVIQRYLFGDALANSLNNGWANIVLREEATAEVAQAPAVIVGPFSSLPVGWVLPEETVPIHYVGNPGKVDEALLRTPRVHPLTGEAGMRVFRTGSGGCGWPVFSATSVIGRSIKTALGVYDFREDGGLHFFYGPGINCGVRMNGVNLAAALGVLILSEARGGCDCMIPFRTSIAFAPAEERLHEDWALFSDRNADGPVRQGAVNLGAFGDRRDDDGTLWLAYPRVTGGVAFPRDPTTRQLLVNAPPMSSTIQVPLQVEYLRAPGLGTYRANADRVTVAGTDRPWLYASGYRGIQTATLTVNAFPPLASKAVTTAVTIDGKLDEQAWAGDAEVVLPYSKTEVRLRHDAESLYVGLRRPPVLNRLGQVVPWIAKTTGEDAEVWNDDAWELFLSDAAGHRVVHLGVSASGARYDALATGAGEEDRRWNAAWQSIVTADETGLLIEMAVPLQILADAGLHPGHLAINFLLNQRDVSSVAPGFIATGTDRRDPPLYHGLQETLMSPGTMGRSRCVNFTPLGLGATPTLAPRAFTVRLHFAELDDVKPGDRVFDVKLQGQTVLKDFDVAKEAGLRTALVKEFTHIQATETLVVEFVPKRAPLTATTAPILNAIEVYEEGFVAPAPPEPGNAVTELMGS